MAEHKVSYKVEVTGNGEQGFKKITKASGETRKSIEAMRKDLAKLKAQRDQATDTRRLRELNREIANTEKALKRAESGANGMGLSLGKMKAVGVAAAAVVGAGLIKVGKAAMTANMEMEKYQVTLKTMLGSTKAAGERMAEYMDIAKITPFKLSEVVEGGNQLQAMGKYSRQNLEMLGDLAAASGKPLQQVMGAYGKLASGQKGMAVDMFRDLLITTNDWVEATGKGVEKSGQLKASVEDMMAALPKIMEKKGFMGLMAAQSATTEGKISNLEDAVFSLSDAIGERMQPTVKSVVGWLGKMTGKMEEAVRIPTVEKIAREKVELNLMVGELIKANDGEGDRNRWIQELNLKYPEFLKNINMETNANEQLRAKLVEVNRQYDIRMKKAALQRRMDALEESMADEMDDIVKYQLALEAQKQLPGLKKQLGGQAQYNIMKSSGGKKFGVWNPKLKTYVERDATDAEFALYAQIKAYEDNLTLFGNDEKKKAEAERKYKELQAQRDAIQKMYDATDEGTSGDGDNGGGGTGGGNAENGGGSGSADGGGGGGTTTGGGYSGGGGGGGRNVTTKIGTLVGTININTTNLTEGAAEIKRLVAQALTEAIPSN